MGTKASQSLRDGTAAVRLTGLSAALMASCLAGRNVFVIFVFLVAS